MASLKTIRAKIRTGESQGNKAIKLLQMAFINLKSAELLASEHSEHDDYQVCASDAEFVAKELLEALREVG